MVEFTAGFYEFRGAFLKDISVFSRFKLVSRKRPSDIQSANILNTHKKGLIGFFVIRVMCGYIISDNICVLSMLYDPNRFCWNSCYYGYSSKENFRAFLLI